MKKFEIQSPILFIKSFNFYAANAEKRLWVQTMNFDPGEKVNVFLQSFIGAASRGLHVQINVDWMAEIFFKGKFSFSPILDLCNFKKNSQVKIFNERRQKMYKQLLSSKIGLTVTNKPIFPISLLPVVGRNHIKMFIVDDEVAWIGGVNLMESAFDNLDLMVQIREPKIIQVLLRQFPQVNNSKPFKDYAIACSENTRVLVDAGRFNKSIIFSESLEKIRKAKRNVIFVSQFVPDFSILDALIQAAEIRGVKVLIVTSDQGDEMFQAFPYRLLYQIFLVRTNKKNNISLIHLNKKVHIKLIVIDSEEVIFGSHNFSQLGGLFGTAEIALAIKSSQLALDFKQYLLDKIDPLKLPINFLEK